MSHKQLDELIMGLALAFTEAMSAALTKRLLPISPGKSPRDTANDMPELLALESVTVKREGDCTLPSCTVTSLPA